MYNLLNRCLAVLLVTMSMTVGMGYGAKTRHDKCAAAAYGLNVKTFNSLVTRVTDSYLLYLHGILANISTRCDQVKKNIMMHKLVAEMQNRTSTTDFYHAWTELSNRMMRDYCREHPEDSACKFLPNADDE